MYTTAIFGSENITFPGSSDICELIDEFCSGKKELNDKLYKKTGHLKPYSYLPYLLTHLTLDETGPKLSKNFLQFTTFCISFALYRLILCLTLPKIFPTSLKTLGHLLLPAKSSGLLAIAMALSTDRMIAKIAKQLISSHLAIKSPTQIVIWDDREEIAIANQSENIVEIRSLSNIQLKNKKPLNTIPQIYFPLTPQSKLKKNGLTYELKNGKVVICLPEDNSKDMLRSLSTPTNITTFGVSNNGNTLVTIDENGSLCKLKSQERQDLYTIMNSE